MLNFSAKYFFTIKDLREAIAPEATAHIDKVTDDELKKHRVGGRLVTRKEIARSKKCKHCLEPRHAVWY